MAGTTAVGADVAVPLGHQEAMILAATEFDRMAAQLQALSPCDWAQPTVCELWDVRAMAAHVRERTAYDARPDHQSAGGSGPKAVRARRRTPAPVRMAVRLKNDPPFDAERWRYGFLVDTVFTRDTWMHRLDISRATGRPMELTAGHDGRLVADVVTEWARRHSQPFALTLNRHGRRPVALRGGWGAPTARCARPVPRP
jgi:uncharacterized protein (TIGR03083 family)